MSRFLAALFVVVLAMVPLPADAKSPQRDWRQVNVYLAAGVNRIGRTGVQIASCNRHNTDNCGIYRVQWNLDRMHGVTARSIVDHPRYAETFPAVNPSGTHLAYESRQRGTTENDIYTIRVKPSYGRPEPIVVTPVPLVNGPNTDYGIWRGRYPNWQTDDGLLFSREAYSDDDYEGFPQWWDLYRVGIDYVKGDAALSPIQAALVFGDVYGSVDTTSYAAEDPFTSPLARDLVAAHTHRGDGKGLCEAPDGTLVGAADASKCMAIPAVIDLASTTSPGIIDVDYGAAGINSCAHLALNSDGTQLLCTEQLTWTPADNCRTCGEKVNQDRIYGFDYDAETGRYEPMVGGGEYGLLFRHLGPVGLHVFDSRYPTADTPGPGGLYCERGYLHKYAEWCGTDDYVVATVFCSTEAASWAGEATLYSRIMLIDISDRLYPEYYDVTSELERLTHAREGSYHGFSATCANYEE
ncbi:MAG: hypothetical protein ACK2T6_00095 [Anaerolineae bacterium]